MNQVVATSIAPHTWEASRAAIRSVEWRDGHLSITLGEIKGTKTVVVHFRTIEAFRVLDERDLGEYWPTCSSPNGWLYQVSQFGWLSQEVQRGSLAPDMNPKLQEFFIAGMDECVSVLSVHAPKIDYTQSSPNEA